MKRRRSLPVQQPASAFAGFRFPPEVNLLAVRWYLRYGLSYRDLEAERGIEVDHVTLFFWVQRFTPSLASAAETLSTQSAAVGSSTRPAPRLLEDGDTCTGQWINKASS